MNSIAPGPVSNHTIYKKSGIIIEWSTPINTNGILTYYLVEWTIANQTHHEQIPYRSGTNRNTFKVLQFFFQISI